MTREQILSAINSNVCHCRRCTKDREQVIDKLTEIGALKLDPPPRPVPLTAAEAIADVQLGTERSPSMWLIGRGPHGAERILAALERHGFEVVRKAPRVGDFVRSFP